MKKFVNDVLWTPLQKLWHDFYDMIDNVVVMLLIFLIGWFAARIVRLALSRFLLLIKFDRLAFRIGFTQALSRAGIRREPSAVLGLVAYYSLFVVFLFLGLGALESVTINALRSQLLMYVPKLAVASVILLAGYLLSAFINRTVLLAAVNANVQFAHGLAVAAQSLVLFFFLAIALEQLDIGQGIVAVTFSILLGGVVLALALAFGLGGQDLAREILERRFGKLSKKSKRQADKDEISYL
jgi:hypothetical protein